MNCIRGIDYPNYPERFRHFPQCIQANAGA